MTAFGPYTAVAGQLQTCQLGPLDSKSILIQNRSRFDLGISLANHVPPVVSQFGGGEWDSVVPAGDRAAIDIDEVNYVRGAWMGQMYVLPIDPSKNQAVSGVYSSSPVFYARTSPLPAPYGGYSASQGTDITNQPRIITLPTSTTDASTGIMTLSGVVNVGSVSPSPANVATGFIIGYIQYVHFYPETGVTGGADFWIGYQPYNASNVALGAFQPAVRGAVNANTTNATTTPFIFSPNVLLATFIILPATTDHVNIQMSKVAGSNILVNYIVMASFDLDNTSTIPEVGSGSVLYANPQARF